MSGIKKMIMLAVPCSVCNLRCHYCYLAQRPIAYQGEQPDYKYSPETVAKALSAKRVGGAAFVNVCADGETTLTKDLELYLKPLAADGHFLEIVTNATVKPALQKYLSWGRGLLAQVEFKCSFHWLELKKRNLLETFAENVKAMWDAGASANIEITPSDELIPHIDEIKEFSLKHFGAFPHVTIARDDRTQGIDILSSLSPEEYYKTWGVFDSKFFDFKTTIFGKRQEEFCYAGLWSICIDLATGRTTSCYAGPLLENAFENPDSDFPEYPAAKCRLAHCYNGHAFLVWGLIPDAAKVTYADVRNRVKQDGGEWLQPKLKKFFDSRLSEINEEISDAEKIKYIVSSRSL